MKWIIKVFKWLIRESMIRMVKVFFAINKDCYCIHIGDKNPNVDYSVHKHYYPD